MASKRYLLLGGMGYAGARAALALANQADVTVTSRTLSPARKEWLRHHPSIRWFQFDSSEEQPLPTSNFDAIINFAMPSSWEAARDPELSERNALRIISSVLAKLKDGSCGHLVHLSSFHLYGPQSTDAYSESLEPNPQHPYGRIHLACERLLETEGSNLYISILRPTNSVGRPAIADLGVQEKLIFHDCCRQAIERRRVEIRNDGLSYRDFFPMADLCEAIQLVLNRPPERVNTFNLASGNSMSLRSFVELIQRQAEKLLGEKVPVGFGNDADTYRVPFTVDCSRMKALGWKPTGSLEKEVSALLSFQRERL